MPLTSTRATQIETEHAEHHRQIASGEIKQAPGVAPVASAQPSNEGTKQ